MSLAIKFGTDGWRGQIAEDYTFANVRRCAQGFAAYINQYGYQGEWVVVGFDKRLFEFPVFKVENQRPFHVGRHLREVFGQDHRTVPEVVEVVREEDEFPAQVTGLVFLFVHAFSLHRRIRGKVID